MEVWNALHPDTDEQSMVKTEPGPDRPIVIVKLSKFRERARYEDGSDSHLSGRGRTSAIAPRRDISFGTMAADSSPRAM